MTEFATYLYALALSGAVFVALWPLSLALRDASVVDAWWGPGFLAAFGLVWWLSGAPMDARALLILGLVGVWSLRLGGMMVARRIAHGVEDARYRLIRRSWGPSFWWKSLFTVFILQGVIQWLVALGPMTVMTAAPQGASALIYLGAGLAVAGLALETVADRQLDVFKRDAQQGALCTTGLRSIVRHPNYLGEMMFWWGVWLIAVEVAPLWTILSPMLLTFLLVKVSGAPLLAETLGHSRPDYAAYAARTPAFLPSLRRSSPTPAE